MEEPRRPMEGGHRHRKPLYFNKLAIFLLRCFIAMLCYIIKLKLDRIIKNCNLKSNIIFSPPPGNKKEIISGNY